MERDAAQIAEQFHATYERLAPQFTYTTRPASAKAWEKVPAQNRSLMIATVAELMRRGVIHG